jgi:hypothetical protein
LKKKKVPLRGVTGGKCKDSDEENLEAQLEVAEDLTTICLQVALMKSEISEECTA